MRKATLFALMLTLLLTACGGEEERDPASELQAAYAGLAAATLEADITCHYDDETRTYTMLCDYTPGSSTVTVLAPEDLAGISATVAEGELTLSYEDVSLDAGSYSAAAISPVAALPKLMEAAAAGYVSQQSVEELEERSCLRLSCDLDGEEGTSTPPGLTRRPCCPCTARSAWTAWWSTRWPGAALRFGSPRAAARRRTARTPPGTRRPGRTAPPPAEKPPERRLEQRTKRTPPLEADGDHTHKTDTKER